MRYKKKKRPLGVTIIGVLFILISLWSIESIDEPALYMAILLEGTPAIIFNIIWLAIMFATGIGLLKLIPIMRKVFLVTHVSVVISILLGYIFYSGEERFAIHGDGAIEYTPSAIMEFSVTLILLAIFAMLFIYIYKKRDLFEGGLLSGSMDLLGERVKLIISDPSDFGTKCGVRVFCGKISDAEEKSLVVVLENPMKYSSIFHTTAICVARHEDVSVIDLSKKSDLSFNITFLPMQAHKFTDITKDNYSRGLATIGSLGLAR